MRYSLFIIILTFSLSGISQSDVPVLQKAKPGKRYNPFDVAFVDKQDIFAVDVFFGDLLHRGEVANNGFSVGISGEIFYEIPFGSKEVIALAGGIGYEYLSIYHDGLMLAQDSITPMSTLTRYGGTSTNRRAKVSTHTLIIPLEFRMRSSMRNDYLKFYPGFYAGYSFTFNSVEKVDDVVSKTNAFADYNKLRFGLSLRVGFKDFFLFGRMDLNPLFGKDWTDGLVPLRVGISLGG